MIERRALLTGAAAAAITQLAPSGAEGASAERNAYTVAFQSGTGAVRKVYYGLSFPEVLDKAEQEGMTLQDIWRGTGEPPPVFEVRYVDFVKPPLLPVLPEDLRWIGVWQQGIDFVATVLEIPAPSQQATYLELRDWLKASVIGASGTTSEATQSINQEYRRQVCVLVQQRLFGAE